VALGLALLLLRKLTTYCRRKPAEAPAWKPLPVETRNRVAAGSNLYTPRSTAEFYSVPTSSPPSSQFPGGRQNHAPPFGLYDPAPPPTFALPSDESRYPAEARPMSLQVGVAPPSALQKQRISLHAGTPRSSASVLHHPHSTSSASVWSTSSAATSRALLPQPGQQEPRAADLVSGCKSPMLC
jgi:hypothetical protein